ncbi:hypothetical protein SynMVIR181_00948 [Synechococcus sp. MVIR-18-1]|nr:hypothetical protein SynMVIR181_00948 [Synechococcus sp. MVIR-18-1]
MIVFTFALFNRLCQLLFRCGMCCYNFIRDACFFVVVIF